MIHQRVLHPRRTQTAGHNRRLFFWLILLAPLAVAGGSDDGLIRGAIVLDAYRQAYPDAVQGLGFKDGDLVIKVADVSYCWAKGRILPVKKKDKWEKYLPYVTYDYPVKAKEPSDYSSREVEELKLEGSPGHQAATADIQGDFLAALVGGISRAAVEENLTKVSFLGHGVSVNALIVEPLKRVDASIKALAKRDDDLASFVASIASVGCYNWREISGTGRRSYHSLALALDILPARPSGVITYWGWERERNDEWMLVPPKERWTPPRAFIDAFEDAGFVWGGKWDFYDTMHFEYRPELLVLRDGAR
jgi:hypothetical protein